MSVDSTNLLNARHLFDTDDQWRQPYPEEDEVLPFDDVIVYGSGKTPGRCSLGIVTYGNGVMTALRARQEVIQSGVADSVAVIDTPYLSSASTGLRTAVERLDAVVFADVCKQGQHPLAGIICESQADGVLPTRWQCVAAVPTYNPLGSTITFTSEEDIIAGCLAVTR